jgi:hypothetical protein
LGSGAGFAGSVLTVSNVVSERRIRKSLQVALRQGLEAVFGLEEV